MTIQIYIAKVYHNMQLKHSLYEIFQNLGILLTNVTSFQELLSPKNQEKRTRLSTFFDNLFLC